MFETGASGQEAEEDKKKKANRRLDVKETEEVRTHFREEKRRDKLGFSSIS